MNSSRLKKYGTLMRAGIMNSLQFRISTFVIILGNLIYLVIIYYLWKAIYASVSTPTVNGMTFQDTMIYLVLAMTIFSTIETYLVWNMGTDIQSGKIILDILKPMKLERFLFWNLSGNFVMSFVLTFLPTAVIVYFITDGAIPLGVNLIYFLISLVFACIINFNIDLFTGSICLHTQSIWGVNIMKEVIVLLLSGATIPIAFFPKMFQTIVYFLPFQAIYNAPLRLLIYGSLTNAERLQSIGIQLFWVVFTTVTAKLFLHASLKKITVNGG